MLDRVKRLLLVLFLLLWWFAHLAAACIPHGKRNPSDRADRRDSSVPRHERLAGKAGTRAFLLEQVLSDIILLPEECDLPVMRY